MVWLTEAAEDNSILGNLFILKAACKTLIFKLFKFAELAAQVIS